MSKRRIKGFNITNKFNNNKRKVNSRLNHNNFHLDNLSKLIIDDTDKKIIEMLISNNDNDSISKKLRIPLSTIQRRTRKLFEKEIVSSKIELNYEKLGYKRGLLHIYLQKGLMQQIGKLIVEKRGIISVSVHVGNSDLVALFVYRDSKDLLETMSEIKEIEGVEKVMWSEEVYFITPSSQKTLFT
jgi:Lrp/AsnC family transcriptional regulator, regulator for asnA, asnC and gidA